MILYIIRVDAKSIYDMISFLLGSIIRIPSNERVYSTKQKPRESGRVDFPFRKRYVP